MSAVKSNTKPRKTLVGMSELVAELVAKRDTVKLGGGAERLAKHWQQGKLTARERIDALVDAASLEEFGLFAAHRQTQFGMAGKDCPADGVVNAIGRTVHAAVDTAGRPCRLPDYIRELLA